MTSSSKPHLRSPRSRRPTRSVHIVGTGSYVPDRVLTNADLEKMVDTTDEWITTRSGIKERRIAPDYMCTSDMGAAAARRAMEQAGVREDEVDLIICGHSHGGQWRIPGIPTFWLPPGCNGRIDGEHRSGKHTLYINRGMGWSFIPFRWNCEPEIAVIDWTNEETDANAS